MADEALAARNEPAHPPGWGPEPLEQRVRRLEDAVASLQDTRPLEERIAQRLAAQLHQPARDPDEAARPAAPPASGPIPVPNPVPPARSSSRLPDRPWLVFDVLSELGTIVRMFFDVRYHVGWSARLTVLVLVPLVLLSHWWLPFTGIPVLGPLWDKVVGLVLAFFVYKALSREAQRYAQWRRGA